MKNKIRLYFGLSLTFMILSFVLYTVSNVYYLIAQDKDFNFFSIIIPRLYLNGIGITIITFAILFNIAAFVLAILLTLKLKKLKNEKPGRYTASKIYTVLTFITPILLTITIIGIIAFFLVLLLISKDKKPKPPIGKNKRIKN